MRGKTGYVSKLPEFLQAIPPEHHQAVRRLHMQIAAAHFTPNADSCIERLSALAGEKKHGVAGAIVAAKAALKAGKPHKEITHIFEQLRWALPEDEARADRLLEICRLAAGRRGVETHEMLSKFIAARGVHGVPEEELMRKMERALKQYGDPAAAIQSAMTLKNSGQ